MEPRNLRGGVRGKPPAREYGSAGNERRCPTLARLYGAPIGVDRDGGGALGNSGQQTCRREQARSVVAAQRTGNACRIATARAEPQDRGDPSAIPETDQQGTPDRNQVRPRF